MSVSLRRTVVGPLLALTVLSPVLVLTPAPAHAATSATVRVNGNLNVRSGPSTSSPIVGRLRNGQAVAVSCAVTGQYISGAVRRTAQWNRLTNGTYVSHAYIRTSSGISGCSSAAKPTTPSTPTTSTPTTTPSGGAITATIRVGGRLNVRKGPSTGYSVVGRLRNGQAVAVSCAVSGQYISGSVRRTAQWDRLTNGTYISHAYVSTSKSISMCSAAPTTPTAPTTPVSAPLGEPTGSMTQAQFIAATVPLAQQSQREYRVPASVTIAQAILESGWGKSTLTRNDRNFFGMKCFSQGSIAISCHTYWTYECCNADGSNYRTQASFRVYSSALDSFRDHGRLLALNSRYAAAFRYTDDADQFIVEVHRGGYATSTTYAASIQSVMKRYDLYQYNR